MATRHRSWLVLVTFFAARASSRLRSRTGESVRSRTRAEFFVRRRASLTQGPPSQSRPPATNGELPGPDSIEWPVPGVIIVPDDLVGPDGSHLPASAARIYRQHQLEITMASPRNKDFKPGWYPDALIPSRHPVTSAP